MGDPRRRGVWMKANANAYVSRETDLDSLVTRDW